MSTDEDKASIDALFDATLDELLLEVLLEEVSPEFVEARLQFPDEQDEDSWKVDDDYEEEDEIDEDYQEEDDLSFPESKTDTKQEKRQQQRDEPVQTFLGAGFQQSIKKIFADGVENNDPIVRLLQKGYNKVPDWENSDVDKELLDEVADLLQCRVPDLDDEQLEPWERQIARIIEGLLDMGDQGASRQIRLIMERSSPRQWARQVGLVLANESWRAVFLPNQQKLPDITEQLTTAELPEDRGGYIIVVPPKDDSHHTHSYSGSGLSAKGIRSRQQTREGVRDGKKTPSQYIERLIAQKNPQGQLLRGRPRWAQTVRIPPKDLQTYTDLLYFLLVVRIAEAVFTSQLGQYDQRSARLRALNRLSSIREVRDGTASWWGANQSNPLLESLRIPWPEAMQKELRAAYKAQYYKDNKEAITAYKAQYYKDNKDAIAAHNAQYRKDNKEAIAAHKAQYYKDNKEAIAAYGAQYRKDNKEAIAAYGAQYRKDNKEAIAAYGAQYRKDNKEAIAAHKAQFYKDNKEAIAAYRGQYYQVNSFTYKCWSEPSCGRYFCDAQTAQRHSLRGCPGPQPFPCPNQCSRTSGFATRNAANKHARYSCHKNPHRPRVPCPAGCGQEFANIAYAFRHANTTACPGFNGVTLLKPCPAECGTFFTMRSGFSIFAALRHANSSQCPKNPQGVLRYMRDGFQGTIIPIRSMTSTPATEAAVDILTALRGLGSNSGVLVMHSRECRKGSARATVEELLHARQAWGWLESTPWSTGLRSRVQQQLDKVPIHGTYQVVKDLQQAAESLATEGGDIDDDNDSIEQFLVLLISLRALSRHRQVREESCGATGRRLAAELVADVNVDTRDRVAGRAREFLQDE